MCVCVCVCVCVCLNYDSLNIVLTAKKKQISFKSI